MEQSFDAGDITESIFDNNYILENNLADAIRMNPELLVKEIDLDLINNDIEQWKDNRYYDFLRNFKFFNMHKFNKNDVSVSELK